MIEIKDARMLDQVIHGDALEVLKTIPDNFCHSIVCDPPAGIHFMNMAFDHNRGGRKQWIAWLSSIMTEAYRVLKPGAHGLVWALPRTSHWTATALEDAGFEIRDSIYHIFGSGFPKSHDVSKAIDRMYGAEREVIGTKPAYYPDTARPGINEKQRLTLDNPTSWSLPGIRVNGERPVTAPATPEAAQWQGWHTALKPAVEVWWLIRKPLDGSVAHNALTWGTGALNIDGCRVSVDEPNKRRETGLNGGALSMFGVGNHTRPATLTQGRWPSHLLMSHSIFCVPNGTKKIRGSHDGGKPVPNSKTSIFGGNALDDNDRGVGTGYTGEDGYEEVQDWLCDPSCPVARLDAQSGVLVSKWGKSKVARSTDHLFGLTPKTDEKSLEAINKFTGDSGGASRYFQTFHPDPFVYAPKASRKERNAGCDTLPLKENAGSVHLDNRVCTLCGKQQVSGSPCTCDNPQWEIIPRNTKAQNHHPTVKSQALMRYLVKLICPPDGVVLDCFGGSGSTAVACIAEGKRYILIEKEEEYITIARARIAHAKGIFSERD